MVMSKTRTPGSPQDFFLYKDLKIGPLNCTLLQKHHFLLALSYFLHFNVYEPRLYLASADIEMFSNKEAFCVLKLPIVAYICLLYQNVACTRISLVREFSVY